MPKLASAAKSAITRAVHPRDVRYEKINIAPMTGKQVIALSNGSYLTEASRRMNW